MADRTPRRSARRLDQRALAAWPLPDHGVDADKEERGHVLIVAGSGEVPGAALLAALAALRSGAGKLTVAAPASVQPGLALALPEARVIGLAQNRSGALRLTGLSKLEPLSSRVAAVVLGPGILDERHCMAFVRGLLPLFASATVVLDAVAMSIAREQPFTQPVILTPHAGEMAHLTGKTKEAVSADPQKTADEASRHWNACVVLKGAHTIIASDGALWHFSGGNPGLGTSGSGDTLAGLVGGLAARGMAPLPASGWGVTLHARAGGALARKYGPLGYLARELPGEFPALIAAASTRRSPRQLPSH